MLFPTTEFAVFFLVVFTGSWLLRPHATAWRWGMLAASLFFYTNPLSPGHQDWKFALVLTGSAVGNWALAQAVWSSLGEGRARTVRSTWLVRFGVAANLGVLGYFKYTNFFVSFWENRLEDLGISVSHTTLNVVLPIAISFFTFQALSYVLDVGRGELAPVKLLDFAVYLTFFPHLVAGPIVRVGEFEPQINQRADPRFVESAEAFQLIFRGLFKKVVVSSYLATAVVDPVFANPDLYGRGALAVAMYAYAIQIYADFSGYTDMAIGLALLLGIRFPQNFDAPYRALSLQDFWRRWHMTLSRWLRDYLYIPLGGSRGTRGATFRNLFLTMLLGGLWHGANWTFVIWGALHGGFLIAERVVKERWARREPLGLPPLLVKVLQWWLTFNMVSLAWVFFRAPDFDVAWTFLTRLVVGGDVNQVLTHSMLGLVAVIALAVASQFVPPRVPARVTAVFATTPPAFQMACLAMGMVIVDALGPEGIAPFIYFQF
jgi:D-alanyl-lipoteichoic acid acyltransferase DltB (MBOAT superfamily)